jgi:hypothetical protein
LDGVLLTGARIAPTLLSRRLGPRMISQGPAPDGVVTNRQLTVGQFATGPPLPRRWPRKILAPIAGCVIPPQGNRLATEKMDVPRKPIYFDSLSHNVEYFWNADGAGQNGASQPVAEVAF